MADTTIIRQASSDEKKDFIEVTGRKGNIDKVYAQIAEKQLEATKAHKPYCARCARLEFEDTMARAGTEAARLNTKEYEKKAATIPVPDLEIYSKISRFELVSTEDVMEAKLIDGMRQPFKTGIWENFRCKNRGCGISVFVPLSDLELRNKKTKKE